MKPIQSSTIAWNQQSGAVLVVALVMLTVITMIGISAISTSRMEITMATNVQETHRAFEAAEMGLNRAYNDPAGFNLHSSQTQDVDDITAYTASADATAEFSQWTRPPRGSGYSASSFQAAHFDVSSESNTAGGASVVLHAGVYQIAPKL